MKEEVGRMVTVRRARAGDIEALIQLLKALFAIEADFDFSEDRQRSGLNLLLASERSCLLVAAAETGVIGMCSGQLLISTAEGGPTVLVEDVVVDSAWQGRGIGRQLMEELERWAVAMGATRLQLLADRNNTPALNFYRRLGWQPTELICLRTHR